ncbi:MAG: hypothetical protein Q4G40_04860 [Brachybacterium sp.]|nr:hypothetical protein [Brachybacterium sp.]
MTAIRVEYCGEWYDVADGQDLTIGREADLHIDADNPYLHRQFLRICQSEDMWWLMNVGTRLTATVTDSTGAVQAWLAPGARLPLVFAATTVVFTAGPTTYELSVHATTPEFEASPGREAATGETTVGAIALTLSQKQLILALAEPMLSRDGTSMSEVPTSAQAARRLGWPPTKFNRKLDNVCDKLDRIGVRGLRGEPGKLASNRRARLVEHAVLTRLVTSADLPLLDESDDGTED